MLPPSSSSDEGPAPRERDFNGRAGDSTRFPQKRICGGNGGSSGGGNNRARYSRMSEETEATADEARPRHAAGVADNDDDAAAEGDDGSPPRPPQASLERALSHSELEELGFAAHLLLKISSNPMKRARVDLVSFNLFGDIHFFFFFEESAPPFFLFVCRFFFSADDAPIGLLGE